MSCYNPCNSNTAIEQAVDDALADRITDLDGFTQSSKNSAAQAAASATNSAQSAEESKGYRDQAQQIANTATGLVPDLLETSSNLKDAADTLEVISRTASSFLVRNVYYTVVGGENTYTFEESQKVSAVQAIYIEGVRQDAGQGFVYDAPSRTITFAETFTEDQAGTVITIQVGQTNADSPETVLSSLAGNGGASLVGSSNGESVQTNLNSLANNLQLLDDKVDQNSEDLASDAGSSKVGFKGSLADEVKVPLAVFLQPTFIVSRWGAKGDGVTDDSAAIQKAVNAVPGTATLYFDKAAYVLNNVVLTGLSLLGGDFSQSGVNLINNHPTNPTFTGVSVNNLLISGFYFSSSVTRTASSKGFLDFTASHRVTVNNCFFWEYYLAVSFDGGTEINFDTCEFFTTKNGQGSGGMWFGKSLYTGSINIVNCYMKVDDSATVLPEFGIRFGYIDVAYIDGSTTIIRHGHDVEIVPKTGQFAHLIKIVGGILDTATCGIYVQPTGGADVEVEMVGCYSAAMASAAWVFDGTNGKINASISGGQVFNNGVSGVEAIGAGTVLFLTGTRFANNQIGLHITNGATVYGMACAFGDFDNSPGNQYPYAIDATAKGWLKSPILRNNFNPGTNPSLTFDVCDTWLDYMPTITAISGTLDAVTVSSARYKISDKSLEVQVALKAANTANFGASGLIVTVPRACRTHLIGSGANVTAGPMLQCRADPGATAMVVFKYDNTHPFIAAGNVIVARSIYEIN